MLQGINEKLQRANSKADEAHNLDNKQDSEQKVSLRIKITSMLLLVFKAYLIRFISLNTWHISYYRQKNESNITTSISRKIETI